jgi:integrase
MATLYRRKKQFWVSYYVGKKRVRRPLDTTDAREAKAKLSQIDYGLSMGDLHLASKIPLAEFIESFCRHQQATRSHKTYKNDVSRLRIIFGPICESLKIRPPGSSNSPRQANPRPDKYAGRHIQADLLEDVTTEVLNRWLAARVEQDRWSPKTFNNFRQTLHRMFAQAIKHQGFVGRDHRYPNPAKGVDRQHVPAPHIRFLKLPQIEEQLGVLEGRPVLHAMVATCIYAGLRREEATTLTRDDVDMAARLLRIQAKKVCGERWQPKTKRNRVVPISDALYAILNKYQPPAGTDWFFTAPKGKRWDVDNFSQDLAKLNKAQGLTWTCLHFRHTFGSQLAMKGESLHKISTLMGNSPEICRRHYAALIPEEMKDTVEFPKAGFKQEERVEISRDLLEQLLAKLDRLGGGDPPAAPMLKIAQ